MTLAIGANHGTICSLTTSKRPLRHRFAACCSCTALPNILLVWPSSFPALLSSLPYPVAPPISFISFATCDCSAVAVCRSSFAHFITVLGSAPVVPSGAGPPPKNKMVPSLVTTECGDGELQPNLLSPAKNAPAPPCTAAFGLDAIITVFAPCLHASYIA